MILVTGATGNVGRNVVMQLASAGVPVRALTRNPAKADFPPGVEVVRGDLAELDTLPAALEGVTAAFLFAVPGSAPTFLAAAKAHGVRHVVFLSSGAVRDDRAEQTDAIAIYHAEIEHAIEASGLEWTFVRPSDFAVNALQWAAQIKATGVVRGPYGEASGAPIHERDIAAVAVRALTSDGHAGAKYVITGPESLTQSEQVQIIGDVIGRELRYEELAPEVARAQMLQFVPAPIVTTLFDYWAASVGRPAPVLPTVEDVTGHAAHTFREWVADHVDDFR